MSGGGGSRRAGDGAAGSDVDFVVVHDPADAGWAEWIAWQVGRMKLPGTDQPANVLLGAWNNVPGSNWTADVDEALQGGARVVPVVSAASAALSETSVGDVAWQAAMAGDVRGRLRLVVPVLVDGGSPSGLLAGRSPIRLSGLDEARAVAALTTGIEAAVRGPVRPSVPPSFPGSQKPPFPGDPTSADGSAARTMSVLHLTGLRFGSPEARSGQQLLDELTAFGVTDGDLRPDLVVVTGDLAEAGGKREFDEAFDFLTGLTETIGLARDRIAIVAGSHDVNRRLCEAYVVQCEEDGEPPQPPYWPKWKYFDALMRRFYGDGASVVFQVGQEWSLFEIADCRVVVAGLNSTMAETPDVRHGELGERQLTAIEARLRRYERDGWLRIGALHHDPTSGSDIDALSDAADLDRVLGPRLNVLLHGQRRDDSAARLPSGLPASVPAAGQPFELLRFDRSGWRRHASAGEVTEVRHRFTAVGATFPAPVPAPVSDPEDGRRFDHRHDTRPRDPLDDLAEIAKLRFPGAAVARVEAVGGMPAHLRVQGTEGPVVETRIIGFVEGEANVAAVEEFDRVLRRPYLARFPNLYPVLVYGGQQQAELDVARLAVQRDVELRSLAEYQGVLDLRRYRRRQRLTLMDDPDYPPELYVPQRLRRMDRSARTLHDDALAQVTEWLTTDEARFVLVLGSFGHGKTFLMHKLALDLEERLPHVAPMLIKLRDLEKSLDLDRLVAQHLVDRGERRNDLNAFDYMRRQGRLVLLFDGFDELVVRVTYKRAVAYLDTLLGAVSGRAKVVVTSRREFFLTDDQVLKRTGEMVEQTSGRFIVQVEDFTPEQVKQFLYGYYLTRLLPQWPEVDARRAEAARRADDRLALMKNLANLLDLASNPRLLSFIAELDDDRLLAARRHTTSDSAANGDSAAAAVTPADLYHELIRQWLDYETGRSPDLTATERHAAITELAVTMWRAGESYVDLNGLTAVAQRVLSTMHDPRERSAAETAHELGSGTALRRDADGRFSFIHQSVMEYLVADRTAEALNSLDSGPGGHAGILDARRMSELMADFFADRCGEQRAATWAQAVIDDAHASPEAKANAFLVANRRGLSLHTGAKLAGADFAGQDLSSRRDLRGADLEGANLTDARLVGADLTGANLRQATMTGMTIRNTNLSDADLTGANLSGARLTEVNLTGAVITGSRWARTAVLGGHLALTEGADALTAASVAKRDLAEPFLRSATSSTYAVAFSPDGTLIATAAADGTARLWDTTTGQHLRTLEGHTRWVLSVAFSPDGTLIATGSDDRTTRLWDTTTGQHLRTLEGHTGPVLSVAFSPDGTLIATGSDDRTTRLWDTTTGQHQRTLEGHTDSVQSVAFSPDGTLIATAAADGTARLWDTTTGQHLRTLEGHTGPVRSAAFSPDSTLIATGSDDRTTRLWDTTTGQHLRTLEGHTGPVRSAAFSPDSTLIATGSDDRTTRLWDTTTGQHLRTLEGHTYSVLSVAFSPDSTLIATGSDDRTTRLWDTTTGQHLRTLEGHTYSVLSVAFSPDGTLIATAAADGTARLWDTTTGQHLRTLEGHTYSVLSVAFSPDGTLIATGSDDRTTRLWDTTTGQHLRTLEGHTGPVRSVAFSPDGTLIATGSTARTTRLWDTTTGQHLRTLEGHTGPVRSVAFSPDGTLIATGSTARTTRLWDTTTGQHLRTLEGHTRWVLSVAFSPDGTLIATGSDDRTARLWDTTTGQHLRTLEGHTGPVRSVAFSPDGTLIATGSDDRTTRLWDTTTGQHLRTLEGHTRPVRSAAFSPDGTLIATGSDDGTARLWDTTIAVKVSILIGTSDGWAVLLSDGRYKMAGEPAGAFWWMIKNVRFEPGVLDAYDPTVRRLPDDARLPLPAGWHPVTPRVAPPGPRPKPAKRGIFRRG